MAEVVYTVDWNAGADGWTANAYPSNVTWGAAYGNGGTGGWRWHASSAGTTRVSTYIKKVLTWEDMGVPAGAVVIAFKFLHSTFDYSIVPVGGTRSYAGTVQVYDTTNYYPVIARPIIRSVYATSATGWRTKNGGPLQRNSQVYDAYKNSSTELTLRYNGIADVAGGFGHAYVYADNLTIKIYYKMPYYINAD